MRVILFLVLATGAIRAQTAFEVAAIKPTAPDWRGGRYIRMQGAQFTARNHALKTLLAAAWNLSPNAISGGPSWMDSEHFDIAARPPGDKRPTLDEQMSMLRALIADRFRLTWHREEKQLPIYALSIAKGGPRLREGSDPPSGPQALIFVVSPDGVTLPGRNATMGELASVMQRAALDRPVIDRTGLTGRFDFDLEWMPDESQFGGQAPQGESSKPDLFAAIQRQLGLRLEGTRGPVPTLVIDHAERPTDN